jgi:2-hydroxy-3-keto-5-methylthiopentenyl-1-phosphate phosphatase
MPSHERTPLKSSSAASVAEPGPPIAVLCDFDGTVVPCDTVETIYHHFAGPACRELNQRWLRGEASSREELQGCFATITASRAQMEALLDTIPVDPAFPHFVDFCQQQGYALAILSDGLSWIIEYKLRPLGLENLSIYANQIEFRPDGFRIRFPWYDDEAPLRGVSKPTIVKRYQAAGYRTVFVGDGLTDLEAAGVADVMYARDILLEHCLELGIPAIGFSDFSDLLVRWVRP